MASPRRPDLRSPTPAVPMAQAAEVTASQPLTFRDVFWTAALGGLLFWLSLPPVGWWPLGWLAPLPWLWLAAQPRPLSRGGYWGLWLASLAFWAALLQGIRLAHIALGPAWLVLSAYLAVYLPCAIGLSRTLIHGWRWPVALAMPLAWIGLEYFRAYMVTGFPLALLAQSQTPFPLALQTADIAGTYAPTYVMLLVAAGVVVWFVPTAPRVRIASTAAAVLLLTAALSYGAYRLQYTPTSGAVARVMLVQGSVDTVLDGDRDRATNMLDHYNEHFFKNLPNHAPCDLIVWPESSFVEAQLEIADEQQFPERFPEREYRRWEREFSGTLRSYAARINQREADRTSFLVGGNTIRLDEQSKMTVFNAALLISPRGELASRYFKRHLVMFGEYIPFGQWFPFVYSLAPIQPVTSGQEFTSFTTGGLRFAPDICFETVIPQVIGQQVNQLAHRGEEPDVLINTTNDGWFYGSSILDLHFQCAVLRAIENRKPVLIAANTGVSGVIDGNGRVLQRAPKREKAILVADVQPDGRISLFRTLGDVPAGCCFVLTLGVAMCGWLRRERRP